MKKTFTYNGSEDNSVFIQGNFSTKKHKRKYNDIEIASFDKADIISAIKQNYPHDIENDIHKFFLINKYIVTDKGVLFSTHNFTRDYTRAEKAEYKNAQIKFDELSDKITVAQKNKADEKDIERLENKRREQLNIISFIDKNRQQKRLTRLSQKATLTLYFSDAFSFSDDELQTLKENGIEVTNIKQGIKYILENKGYTVKQKTNAYKRMIYNNKSRRFQNEIIEYKSFSFLINRQALISSILQGELCNKGKTWQNGLQVEIERGRKKKPFKFFDSNNKSYQYDSILEAATQFFNCNKRKLERAIAKSANGKFIIDKVEYQIDFYGMIDFSKYQFLDFEIK